MATAARRVKIPKRPPLVQRPCKWCNGFVHKFVCDHCGCPHFEHKQSGGCMFKSHNCPGYSQVAQLTFEAWKKRYEKNPRGDV